MSSHRLLMAALAGLLAACSGEGEIRTAVVSGQAGYLERIALPPDATLHVRLRALPPPTPLGYPQRHETGFAHPAGAFDWWAERAQRAAPETDDVAPRIVAETTMPAGRQPLAFTLSYRTASLDPQSGLVIEAWISAGEQVLFATTEPAWLSLRGAAPTALTLRRPRHVSMACADGTRAGAAFPLFGDLAFVETAGEAPIALTARRSHSGVQFLGDGYRLRDSGSETELTRPGAPILACVREPMAVQPAPQARS